MKVSPWAPRVAALGVPLAAISQDGVSLSAQVLPIPSSGCHLSGAVLCHVAESSTSAYLSNPPSNLWGRWCYRAHFMGGETEVLRVELGRSESWRVTE